MQFFLSLDKASVEVHTVYRIHSFLSILIVNVLS